MMSGQSPYDVTRLIGQNERPASTPQCHFAAVATLVAAIGQNEHSRCGDYVNAFKRLSFLGNKFVPLWPEGWETADSQQQTIHKTI
jgi:hypothetical protein